MPHTEGQVPTPPVSVRVAIPPDVYTQLDCAAHDRAAAHRYEHGETRWRRGFYADPATPVLMGLLGEYAVGKYLGLGMPDLAIREYGDNGDLTARDRQHGTTAIVEVKSTTHRLLIRMMDEQGRAMSYNWRWAVFVRVPNASLTTVVSVDILGWQSRQFIAGLPLQQAGGGHWNAELQPSDLCNIRLLRRYLEQYTDAAHTLSGF